LNKKIRKYTRNKHIKVTPYGIRKFEPLDAAVWETSEGSKKI
jgi:hypothetical protein